ncbi:MAG: putative nucleotidyltransferase with HDIG domain [Oleispira sp.]|jgi:putative nucleotidyltransferase with HDIG domain
MSESHTDADSSAILLPAPPNIVEQLRSDSTDTSALGDMIEQNPELVQEVLETINAPYVNLVREISSIDEAIRFLGQERVTRLITARLLKTAFITKSRGFLEDLWSSSNRVAVTAVLIAKELRKDMEVAYETALFHNIGMALMYTEFENYRTVMRAAYKHESGAISAFEQHHLECNHASLGAEVALKWHLSEQQALIIKNHHSSKWILQQFEENSNPELLDNLAILKLAEVVSDLSNQIAKVPINNEWKIIAEPIMKHLELSETHLEKLKREVVIELLEMKM